jgi:hypothetical protein
MLGAFEFAVFRLDCLMLASSRRGWVRGRFGTDRLLACGMVGDMCWEPLVLVGLTSSSTVELCFGRSVLGC